MKNEQNLRLLNVILFALAAIIWIAHAVVQFTLNIAPLPALVLEVFCALTWCVSFVIHLWKYLDIRKENKQEKSSSSD